MQMYGSACELAAWSGVETLYVNYIHNSVCIGMGAATHSSQDGVVREALCRV